MGNAVLKKIGLSLLAVAILAYVLFQAFRSSAHSEIKTETAMHGTMWYSVEVEGFAVRDEEIILGEGGKLSFAVEDGTRVSNGGVIATVFSSEEEAKKYSQLEVLEVKIEALTSLESMKETYQFSPQFYEEKIKAAILKLQSEYTENGFTSFDELKQELLSFMNQKDAASGKTLDYEAEIADLQRQYDEIYASLPSSNEKIYSAAAGYFISGTDGYEEAVDFSQAVNLTPSEVKNLDSKKNIKSENAVGRVSKDHGWYIVFNVSGNDIEEFEKVYKQEDTVYIKFPYTSMEKVPAKVAAVNSDGKEAAVVLECSYMNSFLSGIRKEKIEVQIYSYEGVMVSTDSLHFADVTETVEDENGNETVVIHENVQGVYIVDGAQLEFVQIIPKATIKGYVVCKNNLSDNDIIYTDRTIRLYDEVVIFGKDLYDGKYIE